MIPADDASDYAWPAPTAQQIRDGLDATHKADEAERMRRAMAEEED